ncbi:MAG: STAS/SEC14 domain-containing protein [Bacteroidota bacterium]
MPTTLHVDPKRACAYVRATGRFGDDDYIAAFQAVMNHPARQPEFAEVWDFLGLTRFTFKPEVLDVYRQLLHTYRGQGMLTRGRIAVLTRQQEVRTMTILFDHLSGQYIERELRFFARAEDAEAWLGLHTGSFGALQRETEAVVIPRPVRQPRLPR